MTCSAAAGVAGPVAISAGTVQITQVDNFASLPPTGILVDSLDGDITGDGQIDFPNLRAIYTTDSSSNGTGTVWHINYIKVGSIIGSGSAASTLQFFGSGYDFYTTFFSGDPRMPNFRAKVGGLADTAATPQTKIGLISVSFQDSRINGDQLTNGFLEVRATNNGHLDHRIDLIRLIFDDASIAEPTNITAGDPNFPEFDPATAPPTATPDNAAAKALEIALLNKKIKKLKKKQKSSKKKGQSSKAKSFAKKIKKLKKKLKSL